MFTLLFPKQPQSTVGKAGHNHSKWQKKHQGQSISRGPVEVAQSYVFMSKGQECLK